MTQSTTENPPPHVADIAFPWGVCIGNWQPAVQASAPAAHGADASLAAGANTQALLPTATGGLLMEVHASQAATATRVAETAALSLLDALPHRALELQAIELGIRKRFSHLAALGAQRLYRLHDQPDAARKALQATEDLARHRHHALLDGLTPSISAFNLRAMAQGQPQAMERYRVLLLNLDDFPREPRDVQALMPLVDAAFEAGIYLIAWRCAPDGQGEQGDPPAANPSPTTRLFESLAQRLPLLRIDAAGAMALQGGGTACAALQQGAQAAGLQLAPPQVDLAAVLAHRLALAAGQEAQLQDFLSVPIGHTPDGRQEIHLSLGARSDCHHGFMVGMSGSGKTTLLNNLIVGIAERYTSDELRLYLMDYKEGVEFQAFAQHPNCEQIFLDNADLGAARTLLQQFAHTIDERGQRFRAAAVTGIAAWNGLSEAARPPGWAQLPRLLLIVDEAQRLFTQDSSGRQFNELLKDVVKRGRSFGVHVLLSTQTLINANVDRDLMSQIGLRMACKLNNDTDCDRIFGYGNNAPRQLARHEFILNPDSGQREANLQGRGLPPPDVPQRLAAVRATRPASQCLQPQVVHSTAAPASPVASPSDPTPIRPDARPGIPLPTLTPGKALGEHGATPLPAWLSPSADASAQLVKQRAQAQLLAAYQARQAAASNHPAQTSAPAKHSTPNSPTTAP